MPRNANAEFEAMFYSADQGMTLRKAWVAAGQPTTFKNVERYYSKHCAALAASAASEPRSSPRGRASGEGSSAAARSNAAASTRTGQETSKSTRATSHQAATERANKASYHVAYKAAHKAATQAYAEAQEKGWLRREGFKPHQISKKWDDTLAPNNPYRITVDTLKSWVGQKKAPGISPQLPGPKKSEAKRALIKVTQMWARVKQMESGKCQKPSELIAKMTAAVKGTVHEGMVKSIPQQRRLLAELRKGPLSLKSMMGQSIDTRRIESLTYENYAKWFDGWEGFLLKRGFGKLLIHPETKKPTVYISEQKRARIIALDETHQVMTTELEKGGPRARVYAAPELGTPARSKVINARHISGLYSTSSSREVFAGYYMYDSTATDPESMQIDPRAVLGLPRVVASYGGRKRTFQSGFETSAKGGTQSGTIDRYITKIIEPAYPNVAPDWEYESEGEEDEVGEKPIRAGPVCLKTDDGPDRVDMNEEQLQKRRKRHHDGYLAYPGLPNGTAANAEMDRLFGELKRLCSLQANELVAERESDADTARELGERVPPVNLTNKDLGRIVNGPPGCAPAESPFRMAFAKERIEQAWSAVGAVGKDGWVTRASLFDPKVRGAAEAARAAEAAAAASRTAAAAAAAAPVTQGKAAQGMAAGTRSKVVVAAAPVAAPTAPPPLSLMAKHEEAMSALAANGMAASLFKPPPPKLSKKAQGKQPVSKAPKQLTPAEVDEPSAVEVEISKELAAGCSGHAVWLRGMHDGMWSDEVLEPILERIRAEKAGKAEKKEKKDDAFAALHGEMGEILDDSFISFEHLPTAKLANVVRYVCQACSTTGYSKILAKRKAMLVLLTTDPLHQKLHSVFLTPPKNTEDKQRVVLTLPSMDVEYVPFAEKFGDHGAKLPKGFKEAKPFLPPFSLPFLLKFSTDKEDKDWMLGKTIIQKFSDDEGGWTLGTITTVLTDADDAVELTLENGARAMIPFNFEVTYPFGEYKHALSVESYAEDVNDPEGSWCFVDTEGPQKKKKKAIKDESEEESEEEEEEAFGEAWGEEGDDAGGEADVEADAQRDAQPDAEEGAELPLSRRRQAFTGGGGRRPWPVRWCR